MENYNDQFKFFSIDENNSIELFEDEDDMYTNQDSLVQAISNAPIYLFCTSSDRFLYVNDADTKNIYRGVAISHLESFGTLPEGCELDASGDLVINISL